MTARIPPDAELDALERLLRCRTTGAISVETREACLHVIAAVRALRAAVRALEPGQVEEYIGRLPWSNERTDDELTLVVGNIRGFAAAVRVICEAFDE